MQPEQLSSLVLILALGIGAQWLAWRTNLPSILLLLIAGLLAGPVFGWLHPDRLFGEALMPGVRLAVGIILFEGGLSLRLNELRAIGVVVWRLCSLGALVTWSLTAVTCHYLLGLSTQLSVLLGAVLVVTGPTVILPLLRQLKIKDPSSSMLRWEGILIDPVGAILAVLVFETITEAGGSQIITTQTLTGLLTATVAGCSVGFGGALVLGFALRRYYLPDFLQNPIALTAVGTVLMSANAMHEEAGLLAVVIMGMALGTQKELPVRSILAFKENLRTLIIAILFIVLAARLDMSQIRDILLPGSVLLIVLVLIVRPVSVLVSTLHTGLTWKVRAMLMAMAPRGIVAAAVSSVFAVRLADAGVPDADALVPLTFFIIAGSILVYAAAAPVAARTLGLTAADAQGVLFAGAPDWARATATALKDLGFRVQLVDTDYIRVRQARMEDLPAYYGNLLAERTESELDLSGIGRLLAVSPNDEANSLAALHFREVFGRSESYQLAAEAAAVPRLQRGLPPHLRGRTLFHAQASYAELAKRYAEGARIRRTKLSEEFGMKEYLSKYGDSAVPLFLVEGDRLYVFATDNPPRARAGQIILSLVAPDQQAATNGA